ncbi:ABC transporter permease subunit [Paenibacillus alkaliterrae]
MTSSFTRLLVMVQKELLELVRSLKLLWVPLVFVLLGVMQPASMYYMPLILEKAGNITEGAVIEIPQPLGSEVLAQTLQQFGTLGLLVLVLVGMSSVSGERNSGAASLILVKPIAVFSFTASKWTALLLLAWGSLSAGYLASWYYTGLLFGDVQASKVLGSLLVFGLWLSFAMTLTLFFSTLLRSSAAAAFSTLGTAAALSLLAGLLPKKLGWLPGSLSSFAYQTAVSDIANVSLFGWALACTFTLMAAALTGASWLLRRSSAID